MFGKYACFSLPGFYARQHAIAHICYANSVCLSVCQTRDLCQNGWTHYQNFLPSDRPIILVFRHQGSLRKSGASPQRGTKYKGCSNFRPICGYISETVHPIRSMFGSVMVFGVSGSNGARSICGSIKSKMVAGGHLGMMALSLVTVVSDGLSCSRMQAASMLLWSGRPANRLVFRD